MTRKDTAPEWDDLTPRQQAKEVLLGEESIYYDEIKDIPWTQ